MDLDKKFDIPAIYSNVGETKMRNTTIGNMGAPHVQTIEHFMAALMLVGVDSAIVEIDGPETPILDGSAAEFMEKFLSVGVVGKKLKRIIVKREVVVTSAEAKKNISRIERYKIFLVFLDFLKK